MIEPDPAGEKVTAGGLSAYFAEHPEANAIFNAAMAAKAQTHIAGVLAYDFSGFDVIGDIGGGRGRLLSAVLARVPTARSVLFDLPYVVKDEAGGTSPRLTRQAGDFFKEELPVCVKREIDTGAGISIIEAASNNALERTGKHRGPRLAVAQASWPAAQLSR